MQVKSAFWALALSSSVSFAIPAHAQTATDAPVTVPAPAVTLDPTPPTVPSDPTAQAAQPETTTPAQTAATNTVNLEPCVEENVAMTDMATRFAGNPDGFIELYSGGGGSAVVPLRNALIVQPDLWVEAVAQIEKAGRDSEVARQIAVGLGQAALLCARSAPQTALAFQSAIASLDNRFLAQNFATASGDVGTAALGIGGGGAGGATGGAAAGGPNVSANSSIGTFGIGGADDGTPQSSAGIGSRRSGGGFTIIRSSSNTIIVSRSVP